MQYNKNTVQYRMARQGGGYKLAFPQYRSCRYTPTLDRKAAIKMEFKPTDIAQLNQEIYTNL
jgi:hypothetical protein